MGQNYLDIRESFTAGDNIRDEGLTTPEDIQRFDALRYGSDEVWHTLDIYCRSDIAAVCNDDECAFFRAHIG